LEPQNQLADSASHEVVELRRHPRFKLGVDINVHTRTCGTLKGYTVDISESGISAILRMEVPLGELVELEFTLPFGLVTIYAAARQRSAFRYGFQFLELDAMKEIIQSTCHQLAGNNPGACDSGGETTS